MKQHTRLSSFLCGVLSGVVVLGCMTAAFAEAGHDSVLFSTVGVKIRNETVIERGQTLSVGTDQEAPSSILYIDEAGGGTTYLPLAKIAGLLDIPVSWDGESGVVTLGGESSPEVVMGGETASQVGEIQPGMKLGYFTELEPYWPTAEQVSGIYAKDTAISSHNGYGATYHPYGEDISISVTNRSDAPLLFAVKNRSTLTTDRFPVIEVPVGETVIRTFSAEEYPIYLLNTGLEIGLGFESAQAGLGHAVDAVVNVACFQRG